MKTHDYCCTNAANLKMITHLIKVSRPPDHIAQQVILGQFMREKSRAKLAGVLFDAYMTRNFLFRSW